MSNGGWFEIQNNIVAKRILGLRETTRTIRGREPIGAQM